MQVLSDLGRYPDWAGRGILKEVNTHIEQLRLAYAY